MSTLFPTCAPENESAPTSSASQTIRILVVGEPHVGKSLLIHRLCRQVFADAGVEARLDRATSSATIGDATIGFAVGAFVRDRPRTAPATATRVSMPASTSGLTPATAAVYNRRDPGRWGSPTVSSSEAAADATRTQTVELFELGGGCNFQLACLTPVGLLNFDGWCFLYDQDDVDSASHLVVWRQRLEQAVTAAQQLVQEDVLLQQSSGRTPTLPPFVLIGTRLTPPAVHQGQEEGSLRMPNGSALPDEAYLDTNWVAPGTTATRTRRAGGEKSGSAGASSSHSPWKTLLGRVRALCLHVTSTLNQLRPSYILSEARQAEKHAAPFYFPCLEMFAKTFLLVERVVLFLMATFLFGPYQEVIPLRHYSAQHAIRLLKETPQCHGHIHLALYSRPALEASVDDLLRFFDSLQDSTGQTSLY